MGVISEQTNTNRPQQNCVAERRIAMVDTGARASLYSAGLGEKMWLWGEAYKYAAYMLSRTATEANQGASPYTRLYGTVGTLEGFETFGTPGYYKSKPQDKLDPRGQPCILLGVADSQPRGTYRILDYSQDCPAGQRLLAPDQEREDQFPTARHSRAGRSITGPPTTIQPPDQSSMRHRELRKIANHLGGDRPVLEPTRTRSGAQAGAGTDAEHGVVIGAGHGPGAEDGAGDGTVFGAEPGTSVVFGHEVAYNLPPEPRTAEVARASLKKEFWEIVMSDEISGLVKHGVWVEADLPPDCKVVGTKWVFKRKVNQFGEVTRYKGRLVGKGYTQLWGIEVYASFLPTPAVEVLRTVLGALSLRCTSSLQDDMEEYIYVRLCDGCGVWSGKIVKLLKSLYGCRQSGRIFHLLLVSILKEIGFEQCGADQCLLRVVRDGRVVTLIAPHVDDLMVAGELDSVNWVREQLRQRLEIEDLGD
ncbi:unnamed protein product [Discosporangium mesarthrocarpum]